MSSVATVASSPASAYLLMAGKILAANTASKSQTPASTATLADRTTISQTARSLSAAQPAAPGNADTAVFETSQGAKNLNIDAYFSPTANTGGSVFTLPPLLLPNQKNINALSSHISATMPQFLAQNNIPSAPASITYDNAGKVQLPPDYPYATQFKQALEDNPTMARELSTVNAFTSHVVEMKKAIPFQQEYAAAATQTEADAVVAKYSYLFSGNRHYDTITLQFTAGGRLSILDDGKLLS